MTTVRELISQLQDLPSDHIVYLEGCDCINKATRAALDGKEVLIGADVASTSIGAETVEEREGRQQRARKKAIEEHER